MKKELIIREFGKYRMEDTYLFELNEMDIHKCTGCWSCWVRTPGRCVFKDLDRFYNAYVNAQQVTFFLKPECGFVSVEFKKLMDRMCPLFMPYIMFGDGGSWHMKRYEHYPDIVVYYEDNFASEDEKKNFCDYVHWIFVQFHSEKIEIKPVSKFKEEK